MFSNLAKLLPVGKVPTLPDVLNFAMLAKLFFQRCFVQKVELCQITRLSQRMAQKKDRLRAVRGRPFSVPVYFFFCCSCSLRSSRMRFFSLLTWGHGQRKPSLALHQRVSG